MDFTIILGAFLLVVALVIIARRKGLTNPKNKGPMATFLEGAI